MDDNTKSSEVMFFLGAGASVAADVPDTYSFVKEFIDNINENDKKETIGKIVQKLKDWKNTDIDVELLLETLTKLENKGQEPLLQFYEGGDFILKGYSEKKPLIDDLKDFIKRKAIVSEEKIQYLQPFLGFVDEFRPLNIISLNYDICIEQFCNVHKLVYQDGFDVYWNPKTFATEYTDIHLYKLHGSVMWYQSNRGGYIKLPVMTKESKIQLITGEMAENLMLYPMQKWDFADPLLELLVESKRLLESGKCKFLIVVGYSFRDNHIRRILWDAARKNKELHLIFVDPNAYQIYHEKLKYYDEQHSFPSSLDGKVVCLPYKFENVFHLLKNYYLKQLRVGLSAENSQHKAELQGGKADWISIIRHFILSEYTEKAEALWERIDRTQLEYEWSLSLEYHLKMAVNYLLNDQKQKADKHIKKFKKILYILMIERIFVNLTKMEKHVIIEVLFNYQNRDQGISYDRLENIKKFIVPLYDFCESRQKFVVVGTENKIQEITEYLKTLKQYLEPFKDGIIKHSDYIELRRNKRPNVKELAKRFDELYNDGSPDRVNELLINVIEIEKSVLKEIIKEE
ncbi:MAG: SIR2 family protein [Candidatus Methanoperedens sp.]